MFFFWGGGSNGDCRDFVEQKNPFGFLERGAETDVRCDGNAISMSLPTGISLTSFHGRCHRQLRDKHRVIRTAWQTWLGRNSFDHKVSVGQQLIHLFWANTWFSGSEYRIVHIASLFATNYLPWIFSKQKSEKNLLKLHRCAKPDVFCKTVPSQKRRREKSCAKRLCRVSISHSHPRCFATT